MGVDMYVYIYIYWDDGDGSHIIVDNYISLYSGSTEYIYIYMMVIQPQVRTGLYIPIPIIQAFLCKGAMSLSPT